MALSDEDKRGVEERVAQMIEELRVVPTQAKEDSLGLEVATLPPEEREYVTVVLLRRLSENAGRPRP